MIFFRHCLSLSISLSAFAFSVSPSGAATFTWNGLGEDDNWGSGANWTGGVAPALSTATVVQFDGSSRTSPYIDSAWTLKTLTFNAGAESFNLSGETLTFATAATIRNNSTAAQFISNSEIILNGTSTWNTANADMEVRSVISGVGSLTKSGNSTLILYSANTYTGGTTISAGVLDFGAGSLGSGTITLTGGQLRWAAGNSTAVSGGIALGGGSLNTNGNDITLTTALSGTGALIKTGSGVLTLNAAGSSTGGTTINGGTVRLGVTGALPSSKALIINANADASTATLDLNGKNLTVSSITLGGTDSVENAINTISTGAGTLTLGGAVTYTVGTDGYNQPGAASITGKLALGTAARTFTIADSSKTDAELTISAIISSGAGSGLTKAGAGTLVLSGANTYTGNTLINAGALRISAASNLPSTTNLQLNGGVLELASDVTLTYGTQAGQMQWTGNGGFSAFGADRIVSYQGGGALTWATSSFVAASKSLMLSSVSSDSMVTLGNSIGLAGAARTVNVADGSAAIDATLSGVLSNGSLVKSGSGTLRLSGANTYTTKTTVSAGTLLFANIASFHNGASTNWTAAKLIVSDGATAAFNVGGTGEFTAANIDTLKILGSDTGGFMGGSSIGLDTTNAIAGNFAYTKVIADTASNANSIGLAKLGSGTLTLSGTNTYTGGTSLRGGVLNLGSAGAIGSTGVITFIGGTLQYTANNFKDYSARFSDAENQQYKIDTNGQSGSLNSAIIGFAGTLTKLGTGTLTLGGATANGNLVAIVDAGTLVLAKASSSVEDAEIHAVTNGLRINSGGTVKLAGTGGDQLYVGITVELNSGGVWDFNGRDEGIGALNGAGTVTNTAAGTTSTITIGEGGDRDSNFSGVLQNGLGILALSHIEYGTLTLSGANTYTGGTTLNDGVISLGSAGAIGSVGTITFNGGTLQFSAANTTDYSARFSTEAEQRYRIDTNGQSLTLATALTSDSGSLTKLGAGTLTLSAANSYTGETVIEGGTLSLTNALALGTIDGPTTVQAGATLELNNVALDHEPIALNGAGVDGHGALIAKGTSSVVGDLDLGDGVVIGVATGASLSLNGSANNEFAKVGAGSLTLEGDVDNSGLSVVVNEGTVILAKHSTEDVHAIATKLTINNGTTVQLAGSGDDQINPGAFLEVNSGGIFDLNGRNEGFAGLTGAGVVTNTASGITSTLTLGRNEESGQRTFSGIFQDGAGRLVLETSGEPELVQIFTGNNTYTGGTILSGGILNLGSAGAIGSTGTITFNGGTLQFSAANTTDYSSRFDTVTGQQYRIDTNGQSVTLASALTSTEGSFEKRGAGTLTLAGNNTINTGIVIIEGSLKITNDSALGATGADSATQVFVGATLELANVQTGEWVTINGSGVDEKGAILATGTSTISGPVTIADNASIGVAAGKALSITGTIAHQDTPSSSVTKVGTGTLILSGNNTYEGETFVQAGALLVNGSNVASSLTTVSSGAILGGHGVVGQTLIQAGGTFAPGSSPGLLTVEGDLTFEAGSFANFEIGGLTRGTGYDAVDVTGTLHAAGTFIVSFAEGFTPTGPATFDFVNAGSIEGAFTLIELPNRVGYVWDTSTFAIDGKISLTAIPEPTTCVALTGLGIFAFALLKRRQRIAL